MSLGNLLNPEDSPYSQIDKLSKIVTVLMDKVERTTNHGEDSYWHFQKAALLEAQVKARTHDLEQALSQLELSHSALVKAKQEAEQARADLASALEAIQEGFALFDRHETLISYNSRFASLIGDISRHIHLGMSFEDYITMVSQSSELCLQGNASQDSWREKRLFDHRLGQANFIVELKSEIYLQVSERRTLDGSTTILQTDVSDMIQQERESRLELLDERSRQVQITLDHVHEAILIMDNQGSVTGWNRSLRQMNLLPPSSLRFGRPFSAFIPIFSNRTREEDKAEWQAIEAWFKGNRSLIHQGELCFLNGQRYKYSCLPMPDGGAVLSFQDVTALSNALEMLHESNATLEQRVNERTRRLNELSQSATEANLSKSRSLAAASHDLLQPLHAAHLFLSSLEESELSTNQIFLCQKMGIALQNIRDIISTLLEISQLEAGIVKPKQQRFKLKDIFTPLEGQFAMLASRKNIRLKFCGHDYEITSDPLYLRRIIQNLIANAIRFTVKGGVIVGVRRLKQQGKLALDVIDSGIGMSEENRKLVFNEFVRFAPPAAKENSDAPSFAANLGLGLSFVQSAASMLGYQIELTSRENVGSRFRLLISLGED